MLRYVKDMAGYDLAATDGDIGPLVSLFFDDETWTVRYFLTRTGGHEHLLSPIVLTGIDDQHHGINFSVKRSQVENSPRHYTNRPINGEFETAVNDHYGWPVYWGLGNRWGRDLFPSQLFIAETLPRASSVGLVEPPRKFFNTRELSGFGVFVRDRALGRVDDFVVNDMTWEVRYIAVTSSRAVPGNYQLISPHWIGAMSVPESMISVDLPPALIASSPRVEASRAISRDDELRLFEHYGKDAEIDQVFVRKKEAVR